MKPLHHYNFVPKHLRGALNQSPIMPRGMRPQTEEEKVVKYRTTATTVAVVVVVVAAVVVV